MHCLVGASDKQIGNRMYVSRTLEVIPARRRRDAGWRIEATTQIWNRSHRIVLVRGQATPMDDSVFVRSFPAQSCVLPSSSECWKGTGTEIKFDFGQKFSTVRLSSLQSQDALPWACTDGTEEQCCYGTTITRGTHKHNTGLRNCIRNATERYGARDSSNNPGTLLPTLGP